MAYIQLVKSGMTTYVKGRTQGYRFTVTCTKAEGVPKEIFVYLRLTVNAAPFDQFENIASPADIAEYPVGEPSDQPNVQPFFRKDSVDLVFRNITLAEEAWDQIQQDVTQLIQTLGYENTLAVQEIVDFGTPTSP